MTVTQKDTSLFEAPFNFGALPPRLSDPETSRVEIVSVPYDGTTTYRAGSRLGPEAIISASRYLELYDEELDRSVSDVGIHTLPELKVVDDAEGTIGCVERVVADCLSRRKFPVILGGEHSLTIGAVRAVSSAADDVSVLKLDAHTDLRDSFQGNRFNHACVGRRLAELCPVVHAGVRSLSAEEAEFIHNNGVTVHYAKDLSSPAAMDETVSELSENVYVSLDLDVLDPGIMPATGTPEPGGLDWYNILQFLRSVAESRNIVGFDVVELAPIPGLVAPNFTAAKLVYKMIGFFVTPDS